MRGWIFLLPMLASGQAQTGSVHGIAYPHDHAIARLFSLDGREPLESAVDSKHEFRFTNVPVGWYIFAANKPDMPETVRGIRVAAASTVEIGTVPSRCSSPGCKANLLPGKKPPLRVLTVCEALHPGAVSARAPVIIVGIFKSGMDQTLRQDCPNQLMSGEVGWASAIALSSSVEAPDRYTKQVETKKAEIFAASPPEAKPRPERLIALYGILVMPDGLTSAPCCHAAAETTRAPARLVGIDEKDRRVIR